MPQLLSVNLGQLLELHLVPSKDESNLNVSFFQFESVGQDLTGLLVWV